jgi:hypothetical protein
MWYIGEIICIYNKLQKISFKNSFIQNSEKRQNNSQSFGKVISLAPLILSTPKTL